MGVQDAVTECLGVYETTPHLSTGTPPAYRLHGRNLNTKLDATGSAPHSVIGECSEAKQAPKKTKVETPSESEELHRQEAKRKGSGITARQSCASEITFASLQVTSFLLQAKENYYNQERSERALVDDVKI